MGTKKKKKLKKVTKAKKNKTAKKIKEIGSVKKTATLSKGPKQVFLGLGSNVGDREEFIEQACFLIDKIKNVKIIKRSSNYETEAQPDSDQPAFINAALEIRTELSPAKLMNEFQHIESTLGRERIAEWSPRTIDIDILFYDNLIISEDNIQIPHPLVHERLFILEPLKEIAPNFQHPALEKSVLDLFEEKKN
ncbi:MAG: 2-amino-4-hydroxy-6-hydroxymethyldihydropteridine diphosphokinase [Candidatus Saganbacteria bacterium]|nr:2-amino-4-hydroxy-6-hydroxymethyldihydropteridine diphosphokinase [Candidatus Saganbacteria bacterium]